MNINSVNTLVANDVYEKALSVCRGSYQRALVRGHQRLSGADLRGRANHWSAGYARSRRALIKRLWDADITVREIRLKKGGRRILVIGDVEIPDEWERYIASVSFLF